MSIYSTTYAFDANPINQIAAQQSIQEFNYFCNDVQVRGSILSLHIDFIKIWY